MHLLPRLRLAFARRPWLYWLVVGTCALMVWQRLAAASSAAAHAAHGWGASRVVLVAEADVEPGVALPIARRAYPLAMVPGAALSEAPRTPIAARHVVAGQILTADDVVGPATLPAAWVVLSVPAEHSPHLVAGDPVAVFQSGRQACAGRSTAVGTDRVEVGLPPDCAATVSADTATIVLARLSSVAYPRIHERP